MHLPLKTFGAYVGFALVGMVAVFYAIGYTTPPADGHRIPLAEPIASSIKPITTETAPDIGAAVALGKSDTASGTEAKAVSPEPKKSAGEKPITAALPPTKPSPLIPPTPVSPPPPSSEFPVTEPEKKSAETAAATTTEPAPEFLPTSQVNARIRPAVVNILCTTKRGGAFKPITGSGVVIDPRGVILTNAHVGQYLLLDDRISCTVRTGNPAHPSYTAQLLYLPPAWIENNSRNLIETAPAGSGEHDWALVMVGAALDENAPLPPNIPFISPNADTDDIPQDNHVLLVSYPAELLGGITAQTGLNQVSTESIIGRGYFFNDDTPEAIDLVSVGGAILAQGGSSGGAMVDLRDGSLIGIIVTSTVADTTEEKDLRAITLSHINRSMRAHLGVSLAGFLKSDLGERFAAFRETSFKTERQTLLDAINR